MYLQIHESIGHPLELDRILGDERNYAGWSFVRPQDFGTLQYGSKLMNVTFDPGVAGEFASYAFDDCGNPAVREYLIKDGLLLRGLGSLESQARLGLFQATRNKRATETTGSRKRESTTPVTIPPPAPPSADASASEGAPVVMAERSKPEDMT